MARELPAEATKSGVTTEKQQNAELMTFARFTHRRPFRPDFPEQLHENQCRATGETYRRCRKGTAVRLEHSMRLWLKPDKMAGYGLIPDDISAVLARQNIEAATGSFGQNSDGANEYTMKYRGRLDCGRVRRTGGRPCPAACIAIERGRGYRAGR